MTFNVFFWQGAQHTTWYRQHLFQGFLDHLRNKYKEHTFVPLDNKQGNIYSRYSAHMFTIENAENKKYSIVSLNDRNIWVFNKLFEWDPVNLQQFICSSGFNYNSYEISKNTYKTEEWFFPENIKAIHSPYTYDVYNTAFVSGIESIINTPSQKNKNICFRGFLYLQREWLYHNLKHENITITDKKLTFEDYIKEMHNEICSISLNGAGEICNRDIELFGLGKIVIRPKLSCNFHNALIPDYHYVSVCNNAEFHDGVSRLDYNELRSAIIEKYDDIVNNYEKYACIGENARKWYLENCTLPAQINIFDKAFNIDKLLL